MHGKDICEDVSADFDMNTPLEGDEDIRSLKSLILFGLREWLLQVALLFHAMVLGYRTLR